MTGTVLKLPSPPPPGHSPHLLSSRIHDITSIHICSVWSGFNLTQNDHHITLPHHLYNDEGNGTFNAIPILITTKGQLFAFCPAFAAYLRLPSSSWNIRHKKRKKSFLFGLTGVYPVGVLAFDCILELLRDGPQLGDLFAHHEVRFGEIYDDFGVRLLI